MSVKVNHHKNNYTHAHFITKLVGWQLDQCIRPLRPTVVVVIIFNYSITLKCLSLRVGRCKTTLPRGISGMYIAQYPSYSMYILNYIHAHAHAHKTCNHKRILADNQS